MSEDYVALAKSYVDVRTEKRMHHVFVQGGHPCARRRRGEGTDRVVRVGRMHENEIETMTKRSPINSSNTSLAVITRRYNPKPRDDR